MAIGQVTTPLVRPACVSSTARRIASMWDAAFGAVRRSRDNRHGAGNGEYGQGIGKDGYCRFGYSINKSNIKPEQLARSESASRSPK